MAGIIESRLRQALEAEALRYQHPQAASTPLGDYDQGVHDLLSLAGVFAADGASLTSEAAYLFVCSLAAHAQDRVPLAINWEDSADTAPDGVPGADLLRQVEQCRLHVGKDPAPARYVTAVLAIIKNRRSDYLLQFDPPARHFQLIGGKVENDDPSLEEALRREIQEELGHRVDMAHLNLRCACDTNQPRISPTYGVITQYRFILYLAAMPEFKLDGLDNTRWVSDHEIAQGHTDDGLAISDILQDGMLETLRASPISFAD